MGEVVLIRHGQANSGAKDEASYDKLSDLGHRQSGWLGDWFRGQGEDFDLTVSGSLRRHRETANGLGAENVEVDPRLNELDYFNLAHALEQSHGIPMPNPDEFAAHAPLVMQAWHNAEIIGHETFESFETRVTSALIEAAREGQKVLCVTSGGVIGMIVRHLLGLDATRMAHVLLPIRNTSIHRITVTGQQMLLDGYNATPHLDGPDRAHARTTY